MTLHGLLLVAEAGLAGFWPHMHDLDLFFSFLHVMAWQRLKPRSGATTKKVPSHYNSHSSRSLDLVFISFLLFLPARLARQSGGRDQKRESERNLSHKGKFRDPTISRRKNPHEPMVTT